MTSATPKPPQKHVFNPPLKIFPCPPLFSDYPSLGFATCAISPFCLVPLPGAPLCVKPALGCFGYCSWLVASATATPANKAAPLMCDLARDPEAAADAAPDPSTWQPGAAVVPARRRVAAAVPRADAAAAPPPPVPHAPSAPHRTGAERGCGLNKEQRYPFVLTHSVRPFPAYYTTILNGENPSRFLCGSRPLKGTALRAAPRWFQFLCCFFVLAFRFSS